MTVAINMWMYGYGVGIAHKSNNGRVKGVVAIELETKAEGFIMINRSWWSLYLNPPSGQVYALVNFNAIKR